jgi:hypothetical protein
MRGEGKEGEGGRHRTLLNEKLRCYHLWDKEVGIGGDAEGAELRTWSESAVVKNW